MARNIVDHVFEVHCVCDRCLREHRRETNGDIGLPPGWSFVHVSIYSKHLGDSTLLCPTCLALVLAAAAPARLEK
jgi:hypothetical protein